jgi:hypothetical protein
MPRVFQAARDYRDAAAQVDQVIYRLVDSHDADALVYTSLTGMGRIHVIVVSDALEAAWGTDKEDRLWDELSGQLSPDELELISVFQVLSVTEALQLQGPLDPPLLVKAGNELVVRLRAFRSELEEPSFDEREGLLLSPGLSELLQDVGNWVRTCTLVIRSAEVKKTVRDLDLLREMKYRTQVIENGPMVLRQLPEHVKVIVESLQEVVTSAQPA